MICRSDVEFQTIQAPSPAADFLNFPITIIDPLAKQMPQKTCPDPIIRGLVLRSLENVQSVFHTDTRMRRERPLRYESLEDRRVLSATGFESVDSGEPDIALVTTENFDTSVFATQTEGITRLLVEVNGEQIELSPGNTILQLAEGDTVNVVDIRFSSAARTGVFAAEGYVNKLSDASSASTIDYNDGRFSVREASQPATGGEGAIAGLNQGWKVDSGWDRLTINLMHYTESSTEVADRFFVNLQVGQPDFEFDSVTLDQIQEQLIRVGDSVTIPAQWLNNLDGTFHNYAEVDIYHSSNMDEVVWAGASVGNASSDNPIEGEFLNTRSDDPFTEKWTPEREGEYVLKYYLDPEAVVSEANEDNNEYEIRVKVSFEAAPEAVGDYYDSARGKLDVLKNDLPVNSQDELSIAEFTQAENGTVKLHKDGSFQYKPNKGFSGVDRFEYVATDGNQQSNTAVVTIDLSKHENQKSEPKEHKEKKVKHDSPDGPVTSPPAESKGNFQVVVGPDNNGPTLNFDGQPSDIGNDLLGSTVFTDVQGSENLSETFAGLNENRTFVNYDPAAFILKLSGDDQSTGETGFNWSEDMRDWNNSLAELFTAFENSKLRQKISDFVDESDLSTGSFRLFASQ